MELTDKKIKDLLKESMDPHTKKTLPTRHEDSKPIIALPDKKFTPELTINQK
jgi:hypothetical protein